MYVIWMLVVGLGVGAAARMISPGLDRGGFIITMLLGVSGSFLAGFIGRGFGWYEGPSEGPGFLASILGAIAFIFLYRYTIGKNQAASTEQYVPKRRRRQGH